MVFQLTILGTSSATPVGNRQPASQILNINEQMFLIDCGEATQMQLKRYKFRFNKIDHIFISHLHGDHYLGLIGLISSMHLEDRNKELNIYAPEGLEEIINLQLKYAQTHLTFPIIFKTLKTHLQENLFENKNIEVWSIPLLHRIPCSGFLFKEKPGLRKIIKEKIEEYNIPVNKIAEIKNGCDFNYQNIRIIPNEELTLPPPLPRSFAYCSDTAYKEDIIPLIKNIDLLYHETTYKHDLMEKARETFHSTTIQAATIAKKANVKKLVIGHFSARYDELDDLLTEARQVFNDSFLAIEGIQFNLNNS